MKESYFWTTIKANIKDVHWSRIENVAGTGIPDLNGCLFGKEVWVELKMFRGRQLHLRNSQLVWMTKRLKVGGDVIVVARNEEEIWVIEAAAILRMARDPMFSKSIDDKSVAISVPRERVMRVFTKPFDWDGVRKLLFGV